MKFTTEDRQFARGLKILIGSEEICDECDSLRGEWHGKFPKRRVTESSLVTGKSGFLEPVGGWK